MMSSAPWLEEESVYRLLPLAEKEPAKPPRYISQFRPSVAREMRAQKKEPCKTMGLPKLRLPSPRSFLQKHSKEPTTAFPQRKRHRAREQPRKMSVPQRTDHPVMGIRSEKNFIATNAAEAIMAVPKKPLRACVDVRWGDKFLLENSGLVKKYLQKKDFGVVPRYLMKLNTEVKRAQEASDACVRETLRQQGPQRISREDRETLLEVHGLLRFQRPKDKREASRGWASLLGPASRPASQKGLKKNWEEINREFQGLSVVIDTIPRKLHREKLETQMKQLEHDISAIEKHSFIYVANE